MIPESALAGALAEPAGLSPQQEAFGAAESSAAQGTWGVTATIETADDGVAFSGSSFLVVDDAWQPTGVGVEGTVEAFDPYVVSGDLFGVADWVGVDPGLVVDDASALGWDCCGGTQGPICLEQGVLADVNAPEMDLVEVTDTVPAGYICDCADVVCPDEEFDPLDPVDPELSDEEVLDPLSVCAEPPAAPERAEASPAGPLVGTFEVSLSGTAQYQIPIAVPPGRGGMVPSLGFSYSHSGGDGYLGKGWSLVGAGASILRCGRNIATDGYVAAATPGDTSFCMGAQRLVEVADLGDAIEYRTAVESHARIRSYGPRNQPSSWRVWHSNGRISTFDILDGGVVDGLFATLSWALRLEEDRFGNSVEYEYTSEPGTLGLRPSRILYTGGSRAPERAVHFVYRERPSPRISYTWGLPRRLGHRLHAVRVEGPGGDIPFEYRLHYEEDAPRLLLKAIEQCADSGMCRPATTFTWSEPQEDLYEPPNVICGEIDPYAQVPCRFSAEEAARSLVLDANGDGFRDLMFPFLDAWWIAFGHASGLHPARVARTDINNNGHDEHIDARDALVGPQYHRSTNATVISADIDGDGDDDLLMFGRDLSLEGSDIAPWQFFLSQGDGTTFNSMISASP